MKRLLSGVVFAGVLWAGGIAQVHADGNVFMSHADFAARAHRHELLVERVQRVQAYSDKIHKLEANQLGWERRGPSVSIPELDANSAGAALALLCGSLFVLVDRRKRLAV